ncbi:putative alpha-2-glucosyltransferase Alg10 [Septoria linicola]|nr:putative alpha-2-glucosyltransferase Alg10 [Septoria linicola]
MATAIAALLVPLGIWFKAVSNAVQEPYLDEVFHIPQAQHYCADRWHIWDSKLTTPPGLYLISYLARPLLGCNVTSLRAINAACLIALCIALAASYNVRRNANDQKGYMSKLLAYHSSLNIALFPPLFFFSALYYTDIASTLSWMVFYWYFLRTLQAPKFSPVQASVQILLGVISLSFRQTNIFWVAVAPLAIKLVAELDQGHNVVKQSMYRRAEGFGDSTWSVAKTSWKMNVVYDPPVRDAFFEDYFRSIISIGACALKIATQPRRALNVILAVSPHLALIGVFASFILWNGGVVLGDKSNHIATINLPQMLYIWPFITFFSWPLLLPHFIMGALTLIARIGRIANLEPLLVCKRRNFLPRAYLIVGFTILALATIHFNTIVHPFMLADNRHYVFYVFKRLLRPRWLRYLAAPVYVMTAWACIGSRGEAPYSNMGLTKEDNKRRSLTRSGSANDTTRDLLKHNAVSDAAKRSSNIPDGKSTAMVSFVLINLFTTALTLCSAPLVEPRYCIIPFIMWRMHLPLYSVNETREKQIAEDKSWSAVLKAYDYRVVVETVWFLVVNAVTGWIFLNWTFEWPSEPGVKQRFMW